MNNNNNQQTSTNTSISTSTNTSTTSSKEKSFAAACERYRAMRRAMAGKPYTQQRDMINAFRAGL